jgi:ABC-type sugar transport system substrate-binding protein
MPVTKYAFTVKIAWIFRCATLLLLIVISGCRSGRYGRVLSVIPRDVSTSATSEHAGAAEEAARHGLGVYWNGPSYSDEVDDQILIVDQAIRRRSYGLIISPNNPFAVNSALQRALAASIPVVLLGAPVPLSPAPGLSAVESDLRDATVEAAAFLAKTLPPQSEVMVVGVNPLSPGNTEQAELFLRALHDRAPALSVVQLEPTPISFGQTELLTERTIRSHPRLRAIFSLDVGTTGGALAAVNSMGQGGKIHIIGCDETMNLLYALRHGQIDGLIVSNLPRMAELAVQQIVAQRSHKPTPLRVLVPGVWVTVANVDQPYVQQMLRMDWRPAQ